MERPGAFERGKERLKTRWEEAGVDGSISGYRPSSAAAIDRLKRMDGSEAGLGGDLRTMSVGTVGIYYIYAFDGRLLAEYDGYGNCLREYIYIGAKMVAEYQPATGKYYYYTTDQVNSTRVVTDDEGNVVYSAAHDPYGGVQQTLVNAFNPGWKFSGHEQDPESSLYYFGARYYDPALYRFLSPDPAIPTDRALYNPQRWNLYGYCLGNPINFYEYIGADPVPVITVQRQYVSNGRVYGFMMIGGIYIGRTVENADERFKLSAGSYIGILTYGQVRRSDGTLEWIPAICLYERAADGSLIPIIIDGYQAAIHDDRNCNAIPYGCILVSEWQMNLILDTLTDERNYVFEDLMKLASESMMLSGIDQIFSSFQLLELLTELSAFDRMIIELVSIMNRVTVNVNIYDAR